MSVVHHFAMIRVRTSVSRHPVWVADRMAPQAIAAGDLHITLPEDFGVAPSTLAARSKDSKL
jgi:hypothetical protein